MRCLSSALGSRFGGMPGSRGCTTTSSSSSCGICRSAWTGLTLGSGLDSFMTQPAAATSATQPAAASPHRIPRRKFSPSSRTIGLRPHRCALLLPLCISLVVDVFLPEFFLQLRVGFLLRRLAQPPRHDIVVAAVGNLTSARAVAGVVVGLLRGLLGFQIARGIAASRGIAAPVCPARLVIGGRHLGAGAARSIRALVRALSLGGGTARRGRAPRIALLRNALLLGAQLRVKGAERIVEPLVEPRATLVRGLSRTVRARSLRAARPAARGGSPRAGR